MLTYEKIQEEYRSRNNKSISTCAIADSKRRLGYEVKPSHNRKCENEVQKKATDFEVKEVSIILSMHKASP